MEKPIYEDFSDSVGYKRYLFLLRISEYGSRLKGYEKVEMLKKITQIRDFLDLNELELSLFHLYMEKFGWRAEDNLDEVLWYVGYAAKSFLNEFSSDLELNLQSKLPFFRDYRKWILKYSSCLNVGYADINFIYNKLCRADVTAEEVDPFDYNSAVVQLIETSTRPDRT